MGSASFPDSTKKTSTELIEFAAELPYHHASMVFNSPDFILFFIVVYALYRALSHRGQNAMLLLASYVFYGWWDWRFLSLIAASTVIDFFCGRAMARASQPARRKLLLLVSLTANLGLLGFFKYFDFFSESAADLARALEFQVDPVVLGVILPVGISFYTFQTLSYTIDIYRGTLEPEERFSVFALFVAFFPQLVAGPIERASHLLPQLREERQVTWDDITAGAWLCAWGFYLKSFMADNLAPLADYAFNNASHLNLLEGLVGVYAFAFQIFGDFAGYSMIAIGISRLMGIDLITNFLYPYWVTNPQDFWRHWHISLSRWLRDYLYISLGGNRGSTYKAYRNLGLTMLLGGLWHGAEWTFVLWGVYQGTILIVHRLWVGKRRSGEDAPQTTWQKLRWIVKVVWMFQITCIGWLIFRADSLTQLTDYLAAMATQPLSVSPLVTYGACSLLFHAAPAMALLSLQARRGSGNLLTGFSERSRIAIYVYLYFCLTMFAEYNSKPFIYFQF